MENYQMISVIIPTLWKCSLTLSVLEELSKHELVSEIILIDNSELNININIPKVKHIKESENIFVNPAWNKGVSLSTQDKLFIINDDIIFDTSLIDKVYDFITEDIGMIGMGSNCFDNNSSLEVSVSATWSRPLGYGCAFFIHKNSYLLIPDELKIWFGDDWLFRKTRKQNYQFNNHRINGQMSLSCSDPKFGQRICEDNINWERLMKDE